MMDPDGNTPITIHAGGFPAQKWKKIEEEADGRKETRDLRTEMMLINQQTGEVQPVRYKERMRIGKEGPEPWTVERQMDNLNRTSWDREKFQLLQWKKMMDEKEDRTEILKQQVDYNGLLQEEEKGILTGEGKKKLAIVNQELKENESFKDESYQNMRSAVEDMYERFEKYPDKDDLEYQEFKKRKYPLFKRAFELQEKEMEKRKKEFFEA